MIWPLSRSDRTKVRAVDSSKSETPENVVFSQASTSRSVNALDICLSDLIYVFVGRDDCMRVESCEVGGKVVSDDSGSCFSALASPSETPPIPAT